MPQDRTGAHDPDEGYRDAMGELPPNVPPGFLGEVAPDMRKADDDGPHGLNAGLIQEWTPEMTFLIIVLTYLLFFPLAYVILWRTRTMSRRRKIALGAIMTAGIVTIGFLYATGAIYFA